MRADGKTAIPLALAAALAVALAPAAAKGQYSAPDARFTNVNEIGLMINNNGFLGTNLPSASGEPATMDPSFEYPLGTNQERMIRGGIWIGAVDVDGDSLVSTSTITGAYSDPIESEFREASLIRERSSLRNSPVYDIEAVSEQDLLCSFIDTDSTILSRHRPLNIQVDYRTYAWSFDPVDQFLVLSCTIRNAGRSRLQDLYVGLYAELISCNKAFEGPAEGGGNFPGRCFDTKHLEYDSERRLVGCHFYLFDQTILPGWGGYALLGSSPDSIQGKTITYDWWRWTSDEGDRETDRIRYARLASGVVDGTVSDLTGGDGEDPPVDPVEVVAAGPYRFLDPGDTLNVVFAFVGGKDWEDFQFRCDWAQRTYDSNYEIPEPPPSPALAVDPGPGSVRLFWDASPETIPDPVLPDSLDFQGYRVYVSRDNVDYTLVGEYDIVDTIGFNTGFEAVRSRTEIDGWEYEYALTIPNLKDGFPYYVAVTSYDRGDKTSGVPPLESGVSQNRVAVVPGPDPRDPGEEEPGVIVFPNPYRGESAWDGAYPRERLLYFANLPRRCTIRIFTLAGDLVDTIEFDSATYRATDNAVLYDPDFPAPVLSGGLAAWDLLTREDQSIASGLYVFSVDNAETGRSRSGSSW
ncbi:MAG: hypothetical protein ABIH26_09815 [Candidatus Eisenbacteria bacterium]